MSDYDDEIPTPTWRASSPPSKRSAFESDSRRRRYAEATAEETPDYVTPAFALLERELAEPDHEVLRRMRRSSDDPATYADIVKFSRELVRASRAGDNMDRVAALERDVGMHRKLIRWIGAAAAASIVSVVGFVYQRGLSEGNAAVRLERVEREVDALRARELDRRSSLFPSLEPIASKGPMK